MIPESLYGDVYTKIAVGVLFYNEKDGLKRLIPSLLGVGIPKDDIICFDGPFDMYPHDNKQRSTDGSLEYLKSKGIKVIDCGIMPHIEKTNARLHVIGKMGYDAMLAVDCDEYLLGSWKGFNEHIDILQRNRPIFSYAVPFYDKDGFYESRQIHQRLFFDLDLLNYKGLHFTVFHDLTEDQIRASWIAGCITIIHDSSIRSVARNLLMSEFQDLHQESERERFNIWEADTVRKREIDINRGQNIRFE